MASRRSKNLEFQSTKKILILSVAFDFSRGSLPSRQHFPKQSSGMGVRRTVLHRLIADRAASLGIDFLWQTPVTGILPDGVQLGNRKISARWIIGADGGNSRVRRWAGLDAFPATRLPLRFSAALSRGAVDRSHGTALGADRRNLCHARVEGIRCASR